MASLDKYNVKLDCSNCNETGILKVSENDYPFMSKLDREICSVSENFEANLQSDEKVLIKCLSCNTNFSVL